MLKAIARRAPFLILTISFFLFSTYCKDAEKSKPKVFPRYWNDVARFLGGMTPEAGSELAALEAKPEAAKHHEFFEKSWADVEGKNLALIREWARVEISDAQASGRYVLYPFSGPDVINVISFYPNAPNYIFFGLEPSGPPPEVLKVTERLLPSYLANIQKSLQSIFNQNYFQTLHMEQDFRNVGAAPLLLAFLARTGNRVVEVRNVELLPDQTLQEIATEKTPADLMPIPGPQKGTGSTEASSGSKETKTQTPVKPVPGIKIYFQRPGSHDVVSLTYFSIDVSDPVVSKKKFFLDFIRSKGPCNSLIKSASYLLHWSNFSQIRQVILEQAQVIVQDDTGVAMQFYKPEQWDITYYGTYVRPIALFADQYQPALFAIYQKKDLIKPLPFSFSYKWVKGQSNLMVMRKKAKDAQQKTTDQPSSR